MAPLASNTEPDQNDADKAQRYTNAFTLSGFFTAVYTEPMSSDR